MAQEELKDNEYITENWTSAGNRASFDGNVVTFTGDGSVYGTKLVTLGKYTKYEWTIKSTFKSRTCQWIGIASDFTVLNGIFLHKKQIGVSWCNVCREISANIGNGRKDNVCTLNPKEYWESGDCITIKLDLDKNIISFYRNSSKQPHATYTNLPKAAYKVAVHGYKDNGFEIISSKGYSLSILSIEDEIFPLIQDSMNECKGFENKIKKLDMESLLNVKKEIKKFNNDYELMLGKFANYLDIIKKIEKLIENELNPKITDYKTWDLKKVIRYICSLENGRFIKYKSCLETKMSEQEFSGKDLPYIEKNDLLTFGVKNFGDRAVLYQAIRKLLNAPGANEENNDNNTSYM